MNKQNIAKLKLFLMGLQNRFDENISIFKSINTTFTAGLKEFNGSGSYDNEKITYNFNGITKSYSINELFDEICAQCNNYDALALVFSERGTDILISADNKNVSMKNTEVKEDDGETPHNIGETSTLLNRNYYVKVGKADAVLKEIGIMTKEGKIKNDKIRKYNQIDHYVELFDEMIDKLPRTRALTILDCGCGKSYLSFVLNHYLTEVKKIKCHFIGLDYKESVIETSKAMAKNLGYRNMEFHAVDIHNYTPDSKINVVMSLHACDTATDMALALGIRVESDAIIAVPCCHRELLSQYSYEPFKNIMKYGALKSRLADVLTDGMRAMMLEAHGYDVSVVEYISPLETPKNLMIRAIKTKDQDDDVLQDYMSLMGELNAYPALYAYLNSGMDE